MRWNWMPMFLQINSNLFASQYCVVHSSKSKNMIACNLAITLGYEYAHAVWQKRNHTQFTAAFLNAVRLGGVEA